MEDIARFDVDDATRFHWGGLHGRVVTNPPYGERVMERKEAEELGIRTIRWSDLDGNGHLFSGNYADIIWDALPEDLQIQTPREFQINYSREAVLGDTLRLEGFRGEAGYFVEGLGPRGACFTALCAF